MVVVVVVVVVVVALYDIYCRQVVLVLALDFQFVLSGYGIGFSAPSLAQVADLSLST